MQVLCSLAWFRLQYRIGYLFGVRKVLWRNSMKHIIASNVILLNTHMWFNDTHTRTRTRTHARTHARKHTTPLTLSQWSSSGNPVAIQCAWNLDPSVHWNATGGMPVCFQWSSSGFPVVFQCVPIMQINTGSPLGHHWVQASASVVPMASQCTCGSSGLLVCSNYAN